MIEKIPNFRHLSAAAEIARRGSISRAAASLHLSQSAVSQGIAALEATVGERLFDRTRGGMHPTAAGRMLIPRIIRAFQKLKAMEGAVSARPIGDPGLLYRRVTSTQLRALIAVVEAGGFSLAAREIGLSQPSVYRSAKELEALCRCQLFQRTSTGIEATRVAKRLARYASLAFAEIRQGIEEIDELHGRMQSRVAVGCLPLARAELLPRAITQLLSIHPSAAVKVLDGPYDEQLHALLNGRVDVIIGALRKRVPSDQVAQEALFDDPLSILVRHGHALLKRGIPDPDELARLHWVVPRQRTPARDHFNKYFAERNLSPPAHIVECSSLATIRGLLMQSDRAALLSVRQAGAEIESGQLGVLLDPLPGTERTIGMTFRKDWQPTSVQAEFLDSIRRVSAR